MLSKNTNLNKLKLKLAVQFTLPNFEEFTGIRLEAMRAIFALTKEHYHPTEYEIPELASHKTIGKRHNAWYRRYYREGSKAKEGEIQHAVLFNDEEVRLMVR